jgi:hypothetical protein
MTTTTATAEPTTTTTFDLGPITVAISRRLDLMIHQEGSCHCRHHAGGCVSDDTIANILGVARRTVLRWRHNGLTWDSADKAAITLGSHPAILWGQRWWNLDD